SARDFPRSGGMLTLYSAGLTERSENSAGCLIRPVLTGGMEIASTFTLPNTAFVEVEAILFTTAWPYLPVPPPTRPPGSARPLRPLDSRSPGIGRRRPEPSAGPKRDSRVRCCDAATRG